MSYEKRDVNASNQYVNKEDFLFAFQETRQFLEELFTERTEWISEQQFTIDNGDKNSFDRVDSLTFVFIPLKREWLTKDM